MIERSPSNVLPTDMKLLNDKGIVERKHSNVMPSIEIASQSIAKCKLCRRIVERSHFNVLLAHQKSIDDKSNVDKNIFIAVSSI